MDHPEKWARSVGGHMYRSTLDISDSFDSFKSIAISQQNNLMYSAPGCFNDLDMLTVGMNGVGNVADGGCSELEYTTEFVLWCLFGTPLMLGGDIRTMSDSLIKLITNRKLIEINQDPECRPAFEVSAHPWMAGKKAFMRFLADGSYAVAFFNFADTEGAVPFYLSSAGLGRTSGYGMTFEDLLTGEKTEIKKDYFEAYLPPRGCAIYKAELV